MRPDDAVTVDIHMFKFGTTPVLAVSTAKQTTFYELKAGFFVKSHTVKTLPGMSVTGLHPIVFESCGAGAGVVYMRSVAKDGTNSVSYEFWQIHGIRGQIMSKWLDVSITCPASMGELPRPFIFW